MCIRDRPERGSRTVLPARLEPGDARFLLSAWMPLARPLPRLRRRHCAPLDRSEGTIPKLKVLVHLRVCRGRLQIDFALGFSAPVAAVAFCAQNGLDRLPIGRGESCSLSSAAHAESEEDQNTSENGGEHWCFREEAKFGPFAALSKCGSARDSVRRNRVQWAIQPCRDSKGP